MPGPSVAQSVLLADRLATSYQARQMGREQMRGMQTQNALLNMQLENYPNIQKQQQDELARKWLTETIDYVTPDNYEAYMQEAITKGVPQAFFPPPEKMRDPENFQIWHPKLREHLLNVIEKKAGEKPTDIVTWKLGNSVINLPKNVVPPDGAIPYSKPEKTDEEILALEEKKIKLKKQYEEEGFVKGDLIEDDEGNRIQYFLDKQGNIKKTINYGKAPVKKEEKKADAKQLRSEYISQSKTFVDVRDSYNRIKVGAKNPSAAGDVALIFNFMKMLDPQSVVRESEYATAANAAGVPDKIRALYNKILAGERLAPNTRNDFVKRAEMLYSQQLNSHNKLKSEYERLAKQTKINPEDVIVEYESSEGSDPYDIGAIYEDAKGVRKIYKGNNQWGDIKK